MNNKSSLAKDFTFFSGFILIVVIILCIVIGAYSHYSYFHKENKKLVYDANLIQNRLDDILASVENHIRYIENKIIHSENIDNKVIKNVFSSLNYKNLDNSPEWTIFSWITPENKILTSSVLSSLDSKDFFSLKRNYLKNTHSEPGKLFFDEPDVGLISKQKILPFGYGVVSTNDNFLGTIGVGLGVERLSNDIQRVINSDEIIFALLDKKCVPILYSDSIKKEQLDSLLNSRISKNLEEILKLNQSGFIKNVIKNKNYSFEYYISSNNYPFYILVGKNLNIMNELYWQEVLSRIIELLVLAIIFIVILYYFRIQIIKPILLMSKMAKNIASGQTVNIKPTNYEEFNNLIDRLKEIQDAKQQLVFAKTNIEKNNVILEQKVKERTEDLEHALAIKTDFLNRVSHEVRTPVQGITTLSQGLVEHWSKYSEEKRRELANVVSINSRRLFSLVSNILDFSTFNAGNIVFNLKPTNLVELIKDIVEECRGLYLSNQNIELKFIEPKYVIVAKIDFEKFTQVLRNLITNSIKFMTSGNIIVTLEKTTKFCKICVKDEGIGVIKEELSNIFEPFVQGSKTKGRYQGAGLGLSICRKIIEEGHHGKIWAENNFPKGLIINIEIPFEKEIEAVVNKNIENEQKNINILMIDDETTCSMSMDLLLSGTNTNLVARYDGKSGLNYLRENSNQVDLIFLDLMMPDIYGLKVLEEIKNDAKLMNIPVIIQSGTNDNLEIEKSYKAGAKAFLRKPYQRQQVLDLIHEFGPNKLN